MSFTERAIAYLNSSSVCNTEGAFSRFLAFEFDDSCTPSLYQGELRPKVENDLENLRKLIGEINWSNKDLEVFWSVIAQYSGRQLQTFWLIGNESLSNPSIAEKMRNKGKNISKRSVEDYVSGFFSKSQNIRLSSRSGIPELVHRINQIEVDTVLRLRISVDELRIKLLLTKDEFNVYKLLVQQVPRAVIQTRLGSSTQTIYRTIKKIELLTNFRVK
jgi:hypothetical protein